MLQARVESFLKNAAGALGHCLPEEPDGALLGLVIVGVLAILWVLGVVTCELILDPYATNVAARLHALSISPDIRQASHLGM